MPANFNDIVPEFSNSLFENAYFCSLSWTGSSWNLHLEGVADSALSSTTTADVAAAQAEADTLLWINNRKRFTIWKLGTENDTDSMAYAV